MELRHLRYFVAVAGSLNFTRAAQRVHVTQSTLSHQIRQLEDEIGCRLFDRVGKRVALTESGEAFLGYATRALQEVDQGLGELKAAESPMSGSIRVAATHTFNLSIVPECVALFLSRNPTVRISVEELSADGIVTRLTNGQLDLGVAYRPILPLGLRFEPLFNEELMLAVGARHPLARRKRIRMIELHREPMALLPASFSTRRMLDECFAAAGAQPLVCAEMNSLPALLGLAARMRIATIAAASGVPPGLDVVLVPMESPTPIRTPGLLVRADVEQTRLSRAFAALLRQTAARHGRQAEARTRAPKAAAKPPST
ncbi:LysR substrate-binding domain-containing protein [Bordetella genomosp. 13]|uniref:LysR family transcriptional regulator n=1 Tax=Bordetella genomosp. 13 TaxID=463040 RepID=A0A1W6Z727_9BORD|nr:LysR substrate-binding domain-containing protein [Bordetella genomosp. 13]ARP93226.1 LysR family transcriptional regulator [Bordetella genomosp. 13]